MHRLSCRDQGVAPWTNTKESTQRAFWNRLALRPCTSGRSGEMQAGSGYDDRLNSRLNMTPFGMTRTMSAVAAAIALIARTSPS